MDINKYIGAPFKIHGRDFEGVDCYGLVKLFYKEEFGIDLPDTLEYVNHIESFADAKDSVLSLGGFVETEYPVLGSIGLFNYRGLPTHVGVYIPKQKVLHTKVNAATVLQKLNTCWLGKRLVSWYNFNDGVFSGK